MKIIFPNNLPTVVTTKTERDQLRRTETTLRHAGMVPGAESLVQAASTIREFVDEQERQAEAELETLADDDATPQG